MFSIVCKIGTHSSTMAIIKGRTRILKLGEHIEFRNTQYDSWQYGRVWEINPPKQEGDKPFYFIEFR